MKKFIFISILSICCIILIKPNSYDAYSLEHEHITIYLKSPTYSALFKQQMKNKNIKISYSIDELGLFQIESTIETIEYISEQQNYIDSFNKSLSVKLASNITPRINFNNLANSKSLLSAIPKNLWSLQWDMKQTTNDGLSYDITKGNKEIVVGIIDSGILESHPDLQPNIIPSENFVPEGGYKGNELEESGNANRSVDILGHGTLVAGQIAANGRMMGVAPNVGIKSYRVFGSTSAESIWIIKAIIEAAKDDVDVINLSVGEYLIQGNIKYADGSVETDQIAEIKAYKKALNIAHKMGSVVVASVGNDSLNMNDKELTREFWEEDLKEDAISFQGKLLDIPAQLPHVVTVSSANPQNNLSSFSNFGKNYVDIASYGGDVTLLDKYGEERYWSEKWFEKELILSTSADGTYTYNIGTSLSAPKVSGTIALIISKYKLHDKPNSAVNKLYKNGTLQSNKSFFGNGILNSYKALK